MCSNRLVSQCGPLLNNIEGIHKVDLGVSNISKCNFIVPFLAHGFRQPVGGFSRFAFWPAGWHVIQVFHMFSLVCHSEFFSLNFGFAIWKVFPYLADGSGSSMFSQ